MGRYLNPGMESFEKSVNSEIYVDKTGLIGYTNRVMNTLQGYVCVSRPRRFGKSMAANMLTAYYSRGCDSREIFSKFEISESPDFEKYRNKYNTIFLNMQEFLSRSDSVEALVDRVKNLFAGSEARISGCGLFWTIRIWWNPCRIFMRLRSVHLLLL